MGGEKMNARKRAGRPKEINIYAHANGKIQPNLSLPCFEGRHTECNGIIQEFGIFRGGRVCECNCHKKGLV